MTEAPMPENPEAIVPEGRGKNFTLFVWRNRVVWFVAFFVISVGLDQGSKIWAQEALTAQVKRMETKNVDGKLQKVPEMRYVRAKDVQIIPNALSFRYAENRAAAFSLTRSMPYEYRRPFLVTLSLMAMVFIAAWYFRIRKPDGLLMTALALIVGGAMGNFIDRVRLGYVVDFINAYAGFINPQWPPWPTFNIADSAIVAGAFLVMYRTLRPLYDEEEEDAKAEETFTEAH